MYFFLLHCKNTSFFSKHNFLPNNKNIFLADKGFAPFKGHDRYECKCINKQNTNCKCFHYSLRVYFYEVLPSTPICLSVGRSDGPSFRLSVRVLPFQLYDCQSVCIIVFLGDINDFCSTIELDVLVVCRNVLSLYCLYFLLVF